MKFISRRMAECKLLRSRNGCIQEGARSPMCLVSDPVSVQRKKSKVALCESNSATTLYYVVEAVSPRGREQLDHYNVVQAILLIVSSCVFFFGLSSFKMVFRISTSARL